MALADHTLIAAYPLTSGIQDLEGSYDGSSEQNVTFAGDGDLSGLPVADFSSSYYGIDNDLYNGFDTEYSFSMWLKPDTIGGGQKAVMVNEQHGSYYSTFGVYLIDDGQLYLFVRNANGGAYDIAYTGVSLVVDEWSHVVATWSGTEIKWYVDGALESTTSASRVPWNSPATLWIGANKTKADKQYFDGKMSDLRFWYSELTASDVAELHAAGQVPIDLGMDAKYALDSDATDSVGSANGTASGVTFSTSAGRSFADFGAGSYIDLGVSSGFDISGAGDFSVSAWINPDSLSLPFGQIAGSVVTGASSPANAGWQLAINQGVLRFRVGGSGSHEDLDYTLPVDVAGSWNHVTATRDGTSVKLYLNGAEVASGTFASVYNTYTATAWHKMSIGGYYANSQWYTGYDGKIDDVRIWNRNLSAIEVEGLHYATTVTPSLTDDLVHKWSLDTDGSAEVGSVDLVAFNSATHIDNVGSLPEIGSGFHPATSIALNPSAGYTISTWFKGLKSNAWNQFVAGGSSGTDGNFAGSTAYYDIAFDSTDLNVWDQTPPYYRRSGYDIMSDTNLDTGWHHIVAAYDGTQTTFYVDGVQVGNPVTWGGSPSIQTFGSWKNLSNRAPADFMDDIRVWSRTLSASEISTLHAAGAEAPSSGDYDWTHGGSISGVVEFISTTDSNGSRTYLYIRSENGATGLSITSDPKSYNEFSSIAPISTGITGKPLGGCSGGTGEAFMFTDANKIYKITFGANHTFLLAAELAGAHDVRELRYENDSLIACCNNGQVKVSASGGPLSPVLDLSAEYQPGTVAIDIAGAAEGWCIISKNSDNTFNASIVSSDWNTVYKNAQLNIPISALEINYYAQEDLWKASDGSSVVATDDITNWLT